MIGRRMRVCRTDVLFHYFLDGDASALARVLSDGLRPLSWFFDSEKWQAIERAAPGVFEELYDELARPVVQRDYVHSGIFLTPIDFRPMASFALAAAPRFAVPVERLDPVAASLTYIRDDRRECLPLTPGSLERAADLWTEDEVRTWFAKRTDRMFWYVPQVAYYPPQPLMVSEADFEPTAPASAC